MVFAALQVKVEGFGFVVMRIGKDVFFDRNVAFEDFVRRIHWRGRNGFRRHNGLWRFGKFGCNWGFCGLSWFIEG
jgi:hypothetical protein